MKKIITAILTCFMLFSLCACGGSDTSGNENPTTTVSNEEAPKSTNSLTVSNFGQSKRFQQIKDIIEDSMADFSPTITYDPERALVNVIVVAPDGSARALVTNKYAVEAAWNSLTESLITLSSTGYDLVSGTGLDIGCGVMLLSDANPDNILFGAVNGLEVYDIFDE